MILCESYHLTPSTSVSELSQIEVSGFLQLFLKLLDAKWDRRKMVQGLEKKGGGRHFFVGSFCLLLCDTIFNNTVVS